MRVRFALLYLLAVGCLISANDAKPPAVEKPYTIQPGDTLDVRFFYNPELNEQNVQVRPDGRISLQLVGDVPLFGKTVEQAAKEIEALFAREVKTPKVSLQIKTFASHKVYISGEVPRPGMIPLVATMNVLTALGDAGGITKLGDRNRVVLIRKNDDGSALRSPVKLFANGKPTAEALEPLRPYDVILVPESKIARVDRWVDQWIRQLIPANMNVGFQYLWQRQTNVPIVPF
jgi:protein involved in polysaccharide export with SLBB domain